jgi:hypothetical protein
MGYVGAVLPPCSPFPSMPQWKAGPNGDRPTSRRRWHRHTECFFGKAQAKERNKPVRTITHTRRYEEKRGELLVREARTHTKSYQRRAFNARNMVIFALPCRSQSSLKTVVSASSSPKPKRVVVACLLLLVTTTLIAMGGLCCCPTWATVLLSTLIQVDDSQLHSRSHHDNWPTMAGLDSHNVDQQKQSVYVPGTQYAAAAAAAA